MGQSLQDIKGISWRYSRLCTAFSSSTHQLLSEVVCAGVNKIRRQCCKTKRQETTTSSPSPTRGRFDGGSSVSSLACPPAAGSPFPACTAGITHGIQDVCLGLAAWFLKPTCRLRAKEYGSKGRVGISANGVLCYAADTMVARDSKATWPAPRSPLRRTCTQLNRPV